MSVLFGLRCYAVLWYMHTKVSEKYARPSSGRDMKLYIHLCFVTAIKILKHGISAFTYTKTQTAQLLTHSMLYNPLQLRKRR
jgi:hypothetical protein